MIHGFIKTAAVSPALRVADPEYNAAEIIRAVQEAGRAGAKIIVFPELSITGYTCHDLFLQEKLLMEAEKQLLNIAASTEGHDELVFVGLPLERRGRLYNVAAAVQNGRILAFIPKQFIPNYAEYYERRHFHSGPSAPETVMFDGKEIPFGSRIILDVDAVRGLEVAAEICEDVWVPDAPDIHHAQAGATVIVNLSASNETVGKDDYRMNLVSSVSARTISGYIYCSCGDTESTQDLVFSGRCIIAENGTVLARKRAFDEDIFGATSILYADLDIRRLDMERRRMSTFRACDEKYLHIPVHMEQVVTRLTRKFDPSPFVPSDKARRNERCEEILNIQYRGLAKRYHHTGLKHAVIGVSGGLDSTLALLVTARAYDLLHIPRENIFAVTMPCFGTTNRTYTNACRMATALGTTLREVNIKAAVTQHFADIGQDPDKHDVTYENCQARERTQVLMDIANQCGGLVIGTGDMSELALGWATYNGDHMSMYGVNVGVPKTLVSHLVRYFAQTTKDAELSACLLDVLDTPVSPELLPPTAGGKIAQKTEELVGPYELHDFFLYYMLRCGFPPAKVYRVAKLAFAGVYDDATILKWLKNFYRRFFNQQFKRSCLPDGPKVGTVALSPRGDLRMPSDASAALWLEEVSSFS